jgi:hypothetical protein
VKPFSHFSQNIHPHTQKKSMFSKKKSSFLSTVLTPCFVISWKRFRLCQLISRLRVRILVNFRRNTESCERHLADIINLQHNCERHEPGYLSGIALGYRLCDRGFETRQGLEIFLFTTASRPALGSSQPPIQWVAMSPSLGLKRSGREADHSSPPSA